MLKKKALTQWVTDFHENQHTGSSHYVEKFCHARCCLSVMLFKTFVKNCHIVLFFAMVAMFFDGWKIKAITLCRTLRNNQAIFHPNPFNSFRGEDIWKIVNNEEYVDRQMIQSLNRSAHWFDRLIADRSITDDWCPIWSQFCCHVKWEMIVQK